MSGQQEWSRRWVTKKPYVGVRRSKPRPDEGEADYSETTVVREQMRAGSRGVDVRAEQKDQCSRGPLLRLV